MIYERNREADGGIQIIANYGAYRPAWSGYHYTVVLCQRPRGDVFIDFAINLVARPDRLDIYAAVDTAKRIDPDRLFVGFALRTKLAESNPGLLASLQNVKLVYA